MMKYYKDQNNQVYAYEADGSQDDYIGEHLIKITKAEALAITNPPPSLADLKQSKRAEINANLEQAMQQITGGYPSNEVASWTKQETEARAFSADNSAATPLFDALAQARNIVKSDLALRIIAKADMFATVSGQLIGKRQALEDALDALPETATAEDVAAIVW